MNRAVVVRVHLAASVLALLLVATFQLSTVVVELLGNPGQVAAVKRGILVGLAALIPAMIAAGASGRTLAGRSRSPFVLRKSRRMVGIAVTGLVVLVPCAIVLDRFAAVGRLDGAFQLIQYVELTGGVLNLTLLVLNFRDGLAVRAAKRAR